MLKLGPFGVAAFCLLASCARPGESADETDETSAQVWGPAWALPGHGAQAHHPLVDGDPYPITLGGQGSYMFTLTLQAGGFPLPAPGTSGNDPSYPRIDASVEIPDWDGDLDGRGYFSSVTDIPVEFRELENGDYEFVRLALVLPEGLLEFEDLLGAPLTLRYRLNCGDGQSLENELQLVVALGD